MSQVQFLSTDAAHAMQRKHSKLLRDLDRVRSMLPPELAARLLARVDVPGRGGKTIRAYRLPGARWPCCSWARPRRWPLPGRRA